MRFGYFVFILISTVLLVACADDTTGSLTLNANGEDFVREGFVSKDGWTISFDNVYVTLADVNAYQTDPPFDAASGEMPSGTTVTVGGVTTLDLAAGAASAPPIQLAQINDAPAGQYNAISWRLVAPENGDSAGASLSMSGTASKAGTTIVFNIGFADELSFACGEYVGAERKGILATGDSAELEMTFHFDHIFGDGSVPLDDGLNMGALGFEPLAALTNGGQLAVNSADLQAALSAEDYQTFIEAIATLGHVGEGHCYEATGGYTGQSS